MKTVLSLLAVFATIGFAQAGGFGGPPPFTNGSPLIQGVDGSYQATARGKNLTGVFRFTYAGGRQSSAPDFPEINLLVDPYNDYVFFVDGNTYRGMVQANINTDSVAGVFDNGAANIINFDFPAFDGEDVVDTGALTTYMSGFFEGSMDQDSPYATMQGQGQVTVSLGVLNDTDTVTEETTTTTTTTEGDTTVDTETTDLSIETSVSAEPITTETRNFKFSGVRATLSTGT